MNNDIEIRIDDDRNIDVDMSNELIEKVVVQADWNENNPNNEGYIKNKPNIPTKTSDLTNDSDFVDSNYVIANPTLAGTEEDLTSLQIGNVKYKNETKYIQYTNLINYNDGFYGFYGANGDIDTGLGFTSYYIPVSANDVLYLNYMVGQLDCGLVDSNKTFIGRLTIINSNVVKIPNNSNIAYLTFPVSANRIDKTIISNVEIPLNTNVNNSSVIFGAFTGRYDIDKLYGCIADKYVIDSSYTLNITKRINTVGVSVSATNGDGRWKKISFNSNYIRYKGQQGFTLLAYDNSYIYGLSATGVLYKFDSSSGSYTILNDFSIVSFTPKIINGYIDKFGNVLIKNGINNTTILSFNLGDYVTLTSDFTLSFGWIFINIGAYITSWDIVSVFDLTPNSAIKYLKNDVVLENQWLGKTWYAYGTSITNISNEGKYATYLAQLSGMTLVNKGISGGGIGNLGAYSTGQVYNAICNTTDGKLNADLISLECGANDCNENVPLGTIYDTGTSTLCGCFNDCIRYLQANTTAQIIVIPSIPTKTEPNALNKYYEFQLLMKQMCFINRVEFIEGNDCLGYGRINGNTTYTSDNIHQTNLGGYNLAKSIWNRLKNIPLFYTSIPT